MKRLFDILFAALGLLVLSPVMIVVAFAILIAMGRPVLFRQNRPGLHGEIFEILKFRTMGVGAGDDAQRLTPLGRMLRATSIDELPELWNILRGDMSFVGPRPLLVEYLPLYSAPQAKRHEVRPGLTGWAQVNGRNALDWPQRLALDVWYVEHRSFLLDLKILALTVVRVFPRQGISEKGEATMRPFQGNDR